MVDSLSTVRWLTVTVRYNDTSPFHKMRKRNMMADGTTIHKSTLLTMLKTTLLFILTISGASGLAVQERRSFLKSVSAGAALIAAPFAANASPYCAAGVGENCEDLSEGNDFIKALQAKSAENKEENLRVSFCR